MFLYVYLSQVDYYSSCNRIYMDKIWIFQLLNIDSIWMKNWMTISQATHFHIFKKINIDLQLTNLRQTTCTFGVMYFKEICWWVCFWERINKHEYEKYKGKMLTKYNFRFWQSIFGKGEIAHLEQLLFSNYIFSSLIMLQSLVNN